MGIGKHLAVVMMLCLTCLPTISRSEANPNLLAKLHAMAQNGNINAMTDLGTVYRNGMMGTTQNHPEVSHCSINNIEIFYTLI